MELSVKPTSAKVKDYYNTLNQFGQHDISHEIALRDLGLPKLRREECRNPYGQKG
jgi:hypothetical protein